MKAVIKLDVPDWQIGQDVTVYFPDTMMKHAKCELLKEHNAVEWINVKDRLPDKDDAYLVIYQCFQYRLIRIFLFSMNLHEVDEFNFPDENRPGWYENDSEVGYFERTGITHWAKLPEFPKEG